MKNYTKLLSIVIFLAIISFQNMTLSSYGDVNVKSLNRPLCLVIENDLKADEINAGKYISFVVPENLIYKKEIIPTGSRIKGQIIAVKKSGRYNQYGYFKLQLTEISAPDAQWVSTFELLKEPVYLKIYERDIQEYKVNKDGKVEVGKFLAGTALGLVVPGAGTAISGIFCIKSEFERDKLHERSKARKVAQGLCEATNIPGVVRFFQKRKNPDYKSGQLVMLKLDKDLFKSFLSLNSQKEIKKGDI